MVWSRLARPGPPVNSWLWMTVITSASHAPTVTTTAARPSIIVHSGASLGTAGIGLTWRSAPH
jgi:hypothetical protein